MNWIIDNFSSNGIIFSKIFRKNEDNWVEIYDWCNEEFNSVHWNFWYDLTKAEEDAVIGNFEFFNDQDAVQFRLRWE